MLTPRRCREGKRNRKKRPFPERERGGERGTGGRRDGGREINEHRELIWLQSLFVSVVLFIKECFGMVSEIALRCYEKNT